MNGTGKGSITCHLCSGQTASLFTTRDYRRPADQTEHEAVWCEACGYGKVASRLSPDQVASFYEVDYYTHRTPTQASGASVFGRIRRRIASLADHGFEVSPEEVGPPGRVLDLGCGDGTNLKMMKDGGFAVVGVEPDKHSRALASQHGPVYAGTAEAPPAEVGNAFDYVLMIHVLEHTISPAAALANVHSKLRESGKLILEVPNSDAIGFREFGPAWPWTDVPRHLHFFTLRSITEFLQRAGFKVTAKYYNGFMRQFDSEWIAQLDMIHDKLLPPRHLKSRLARQSWGLLFRSLFLDDSRRCDTLRIHAEKV